MEKNNRGFTLIELVLAMAIAAVVLSMVVFLIGQGGKYYQNSKEELELQKEAQMAMSQLNQLIINSNNIVLSPDKTVLQLQQKDSAGAVKEENVITFKNGQLLLSKTQGGDLFTDELFARWVNAFEVVLPTADSNTVAVKITFRWNNREYVASQNISLRNNK